METRLITSRRGLDAERMQGSENEDFIPKH